MIVTTQSLQYSWPKSTEVAWDKLHVSSRMLRRIYILTSVVHAVATRTDCRLYLQSLACEKLSVPVEWFAQQLPYASLVQDWLMSFWPEGSLASLLAHLHFAETQLAAGVMLLHELVGTGTPQQPLHLPVAPSQRELSGFIRDTLWSSLQHRAQQPQLVPDDVQSLRCALRCIQTCGAVVSGQRFVLLAAHSLLDGSTAASIQQIHSLLKTLVQIGDSQLSASATFIRLLEVLSTLDMPSAARLAAESLVLDLIKRIGKAQAIAEPLQAELLAALQAVFAGSNAQARHMQEYLLIELLSPDTLQLVNRAKAKSVEGVIRQYASQHAQGPFPMLLTTQQAGLTYLPELYGSLRQVHVPSCIHVT